MRAPGTEPAIPPPTLAAAAMRLCALLVAALFAGSPAFAQPVPDSSFADDGFALVKNTLFSTTGIDVALAPDGSLAVVGRSASATSSYVARLTADGSVDRAFGELGVVLVDSVRGVRGPIFTSVGVLPDGRTIAAGYLDAIVTDGRDQSVIVVAYLPDGRLDSTFADSGLLRFDLSATESDDRIEALAVGPDAVFVAGRTGEAQHAFVAKLSFSGMLDPAFGIDGVFVDTASSVAVADLAVRSDGRLVVVGSIATTATNLDWLALGLSTAGALDSSFGTAGRLVRDVFSESLDEAVGVTALADGRLLVAGETSKSHTLTAEGTTLALLTPTGQFDPAFGFEGVVWTDVNPREKGNPWSPDLEQPTRPFVAPDGTFGVVGSSGVGLSVLGVLPTGEPALGYGDRGVARLYTSRSTVFSRISVAANGRVVIVGEQFDEDSRLTPFVARILVGSQTTADESRPSAASLAVGPNPTASATRVTLTLAAPTNATVRVVDALGRTVATLADRALPAGTTTLAVDASCLAPGVYAVVAETSAGRTVARFSVVR